MSPRRTSPSTPSTPTAAKAARTPGIGRRRFLGAAGVSIAALAGGSGLAWGGTGRAEGAGRAGRAGRARRDDATFFEWIELRPGVWTTQDLPTGGNVLAVAHGRDLALIDTKFPDLAAMLRREAEALSGAGVRLVVNTHHHGDHTGGNHAFVGSVDVYAHANAAPRIRQQTDRYLARLRGAPGELARAGRPRTDAVLDDAKALLERAGELTPESFVPGRLVGGEEKVERDGLSLVLRHRGAGHTDNDLYVYLPEHNVLHTGDLVFNRVFPFIDRPAGANTPGWIASLEAMLQVCDASTLVVPGHGVVGDRTIISAQIEFFRAVREAVGALVEKGEPREAALALDLPVFRGFGLEQLKTITLGGIYDELAEAKSGKTP